MFLYLFFPSVFHAAL
uniref:Uncharacterized protein n=1 Tax=Rhizophora mucronata TaxID=61149 RepID=A0A2P2NN70_RHIMU